MQNKGGWVTILDYLLPERKNECTGCGACFNTCTYDAIDMCSDEEGFLYPDISSEACTNCGACLRACPLTQTDVRSDRKTVSYAVCTADSVRRESASGGAFSAMALKILEQGGVVCGASYDNNMRLRHNIIASAQELASLRKSKYVQSNTGTVFRTLKVLLQEGNLVMFVGSPCQVAGFQSYLGQEFPNLLVVDFICLGVSSPAIFSHFLEEKYGVNHVQDFQFRCDGAECAWGDYLNKVVLDNGEVRYIELKDNQYMQGVLNKLFNRPCCADCKFAPAPHQSDITLGDFWGIQDFDPSLNDGKGTSAVIVNTERGEKFFQTIRTYLPVCREVPMEYILRNRFHQINAPHPQRKRFFSLIKDTSFSKASHFTLNNGFDVGIIGIYSMQNFGSQLTYYCLYRYISDLGYHVSMIERPADSVWKTDGIPAAFRTNPYDEGVIAPMFACRPEMSRLNTQGDIFVLGSDIMLNYEMYRLVGNISYFDYINSNKIMVAYATSFGKNTDCPNDEYARLGFYLNRFDAISVREDSGVEFCESQLGIHAEHVMDPVLIVDPKWLDMLAEQSTKKHITDFVLFYLLDPPEDRCAIHNYAKKMGCKAVIVTDASYYLSHNKESLVDIELDVYAEDLLHLFKYATSVVTDSFHGICFSLIYQKNFWAIENRQRGTSRMRSILHMLKLTDRILPDLNDILKQQNKKRRIDYKRTKRILENYIGSSREWLKRSLHLKKPFRYTEYDMMKEMVDTAVDRIYSLEKSIEQIQLWMQDAGGAFAAIHDRFEKIDTLISARDSSFRGQHIDDAPARQKDIK